MPKLTFSLDDETVRELRRLAEQKRKPQSLIVREAIAEYGGREDRLPEIEQARRLEVLSQFTRHAPTGTGRQVDDELRDLKQSRRTGWARPSD